MDVVDCNAKINTIFSLFHSAEGEGKIRRNWADSVSQDNWDGARGIYHGNHEVILLYSEI